MYQEKNRADTIETTTKPLGMSWYEEIGNWLDLIVPMRPWIWQIWYNTRNLTRSRWLTPQRPEQGWNWIFWTKTTYETTIATGEGAHTGLDAEVETCGRPETTASPSMSPNTTGSGQWNGQRYQGHGRCGIRNQGYTWWTAPTGKIFKGWEYRLKDKMGSCTHKTSQTWERQKPNRK